MLPFIRVWIDKGYIPAWFGRLLESLFYGVCISVCIYAQEIFSGNIVFSWKMLFVVIGTALSSGASKFFRDIQVKLEEKKFVAKIQK
jgi:hypothetical protein